MDSWWDDDESPTAIWCPMGHKMPVEKYEDDETVYCEICGWSCPKSELE